MTSYIYLSATGPFLPALSRRSVSIITKQVDDTTSSAWPFVSSASENIQNFGTSSRSVPEYWESYHLSYNVALHTAPSLNDELADGHSITSLATEKVKDSPIHFNFNVRSADSISTCTWGPYPAILCLRWFYRYTCHMHWANIYRESAGESERLRCWLSAVGFSSFAVTGFVRFCLRLDWPYIKGVGLCCVISE